MSSKVVYIYYSNSVFRDLVESLQYVFTERGVTVNVTHDLNKDDLNTWLLFGVNELPPSILLPKNYIVYQLEQISVDGNKWLTQKYLEIMKGAKQVWDYSIKNVNLLNRFNVKNVIHVPISYSDSLKVVDCTSIPDTEKDIDILFIGSISPRRKELLERFKLLKDINVMIADGGLWGDDRTALLKRSKVIINIHFYGKDSLLEMARLSVLLANKCFIVSESGGDTSMDKKLEKGVVFGGYNELVSLCRKYLPAEMAAKRNSIAREGFKLFSEKRYQIPITFYRTLTNHTSSGTVEKGDEIKPISSSDTIQPIPLRVDSDGFPSLEVPELKEYPSVSIVTPTRNRKLFVSMMLHQVEKMDYPRDKLEWIILDDSDDIDDFNYIKETVQNVLSKKLSIQCIHLEGSHKISDKRNMGAEMATGSYICHIDDDDYYFPNSLKNKVSFLEHHKDTKRCIGSCKLPVYNLADDTSVIYETNQLPEASMVYKKSFWEEKKFKEHIEGEGYPFTMGRREQCLDMPYVFSMIAVNHGKNVTGKTRLYTGNAKTPSKKSVGSKDIVTNLLEAMDDESQDILCSIKSYMNKPRVVIE
jgi:hypothetical protein